MSSTLTAEVIEEPQSMALAVHEPPPPPALFGTTEPVAIIEKAAAVANALKTVIKTQGLISTISGKEYPRCEAWTLLGTMLGVFPVLIWTKKLEDGWEARVEARTRDGAVVGAAEAQCLRSERNWGNRDDFALRSMAQTRATAKALRMPLGFVMTLGGFQATPAEEMTHEEPRRGRKGPEPVRERITPETAQQPTNQAGVGDDDLNFDAAKIVQTTPITTSKPTATEAQKAKMLKELKAEEGGENVEIVSEYFSAIGWLLRPGETLADLELRYVPVTAKQMRDLGAAIGAFSNGEQAKAPYSPNDGAAKAPPATQGELKPSQGAGANKESWYNVIVPIPHKGQKRDDYLKHPDTIGSLYEMRHGNDEEAQAARQRLWGFVNNYEPKGWTKRDGTQMPPSDSDKKFRVALDAFATWFERNHPGEKL